jgi:hypothetical protein
MIAETAPRVNRKGGFFAFFTCTLPVPREGETACRFEAAAQADEMPDDVSQYTGDFTVRVRLDRPGHDT